MMAAHNFRAKQPGLRLLAVTVFLVTGLFVGAVGTAGATSGSAQVETPAQPSAGYLVVENVGQYDAGVRFMLQQRDRRIWLTDDAIWLTVPDPAAVVAHPAPGSIEYLRQVGRPRHPSGGARPGTAIRFTFPGGSLSAPEPLSRLATRVTYLIGSDPAGWRYDVPAWSGVRYRDVYPGIDLVVGDTATGSPPWRLEVRGNADPANLKLRAEGADAVAVEAGRLRLKLKGQEIDVPLPTSQQVEQAAPTAGDLIFNTTFGGASYDAGYGFALDGAGNSYITGETQSTNFPTTPGAYDPTNNGTTEMTEAFVAKYSADGATLLFATYLGGSGADIGGGIAVAGNQPYVVGETTSADFPGMTGAAQGTDIFVAALNPTGTAVRYVTRLGGSGFETGYGIAVENGNAFVTGVTKSADLSGANCAGATDGDLVVARLTFAGALVYTSCFGGSDFEAGYAITTKGGLAYVTGESWSTDFLLSTPAVGGDLVALRVDTGGLLSEAALWGGSLDEAGNGISLAMENNQVVVYVVGTTTSNDFPITPGAPGFGGGAKDAVVLRLWPGMLDLDFSTYLGGSADDSGYAIAADTVRGVYVSGSTASANFPVTTGAYDTSLGGSSDGFVARLQMGSTRANKVEYATFLGNGFDDLSSGIATDTQGYAFLTGGSAASASASSWSAYVAKLKVANPLAAPALTIGTSSANVTLNWGAVTDASKYQVFRSSEPYFRPNDWPSLLTFVEQTTRTYTDSGVLNQVNAYYYLVKAASAAPEQPSANSTRVGKFTFQLVKGAS